MKWPQITTIVIMAINIGINLARHGYERTDKYNFFTSIAANAIEIWILYSRGFFG